MNLSKINRFIAYNPTLVSLKENHKKLCKALKEMGERKTNGTPVEVTDVSDLNKDGICYRLYIQTNIPVQGDLGASQDDTPHLAIELEVKNKPIGQSGQRITTGKLGFVDNAYLTTGYLDEKPKRKTVDNTIKAIEKYAAKAATPKPS